MKILELTNFSEGICGVWQRVKQESELLSKKGYEVRIFSSNFTKGSKEIAPEIDKIAKVKIKRFPSKKLGGESFMKWNFEKEAMDFKPEIIIAHSYRHPHTLKALKIRDRLKKQGVKCKVFLVTHAPFIENNLTRSFIQGLIIKGYDKFIGKNTLNKFDKVITITKWENDYLFKLGLKKEKIVYIPNGIPDFFFEYKNKKGKNAFFLGRISPIKDLEILIKAIKEINFNLDLIGPVEKNYKKNLLKIMRHYSIKNVFFKPPVYDIKEKIQLLDKYEIFILPSKSEAMPQSLIEAMARGKLVISSNNPGSKSLIKNNETGFLFMIGDILGLQLIIKKVSALSSIEKSKISRKAIKFTKQFKWGLLIGKLERLF
jgi:glycosyltransferase involved in cell wall biosynthesis